MTSCYFAGSDRPRLVRNRHHDGCEGDCSGCQPCTDSHCRVCGVTHAEAACPGCMAEVREGLAEIRRMCRALPAEVVHRGIDSEAMNLLGPVADPESVGHVSASVRVGRLPEDWLEVADNELHPLIALGTWAEAYIEAFEHDEPARITVDGAASYLERNLGYMAAEVDVPFEDFARDVRASRTHVERVLHDGEQVETGAPCMDCRRPLLRVYAGGELPWTYRDGARPRAATDCWACAKCREWRSDNDYRLNVANLHRDNAEWLTAAEVEMVCGVRPGALRKRVERGEVESRRDSGRVVYQVEQIPEVMAQRHERAAS